MTLRPTWRALAGGTLRWAVFVVPGLLLIYAGWSSRVIQPAFIGALSTGFGLFAFSNTALSYLRLDGGVLTGRSLLGHIEVRVDEITRIVPTNLSYAKTLYLPWSRSARVFEVCTSKGPTGLFLSPVLYGAAAIQRLLDEMHITPEAAVRDRVLEVFSRNR